MTGDIESKLRTLREAYRNKLEIELENIGELLVKLETHACDTSSLNELSSKLHRISGNAGTFGFDQLGRESRRLKEQVDHILMHQSPSDGSLEKNKVVEQLNQAFAQDLIRNNTTSVESESTDSDAAPCIWLVERDPMLATYVGQQLNSFGYKIEYFSNAEQLNLASEQNSDKTNPSLLLIDHRANSGSELAHDPVIFWRTKLESFTCPIIFMGAEESLEVRLTAVRVGALNYFVKPLDVPRIAAAITGILKRANDEPERVLIVEDDSAFATDCRMILEQSGMKVRWVSQTVDFLQAVIEFSPEVVLMGLHLPNAQGTEMVKILGQFEHWSEIPIVYTSAKSDDQLKTLAMLEGGDACLFKPVSPDLLISACQRRVELFRKLQQAVIRDGLTGLMKHAAIKNALTAEREYATRNRHTFSVIMLDIDHFKRVNDTYGHAIGDLVIASLGTLLRQHFRQTDKLGRYGGEEFTLILPNCTEKKAFQLAESLSKAFAAIQFCAVGESFSCTLSAGVIDNEQYPDHTADELLAEADRMLYQAKQAGRNKVCAAGD